MAKDRVATVRGIFLRPVVSKNDRYYSKEAIEGAVGRMQDRLASPEGMPLTMASSHSAAYSGNPLTTVGRVTGVSLMPDGSAAFEADIPDTSAGRDLAALVTSSTPYLKGVSIRGRWIGEPYETTVEGKKATTADALEIQGIDWTHSPGVEGAGIFSAEAAEAVISANPWALIEEVESVEAFGDATEEHEAPVEEEPDRTVLIEDALATLLNLIDEGATAPGTGKKPYGSVTYADPGYQSDKKKRYPIDTEKHVRAAWSYINQSKNSGAYSSKQLANIKSKIKRAAKKFNIDITSESAELIADIQSALEAYASMCIDNGAASMSVSGYTDDGGKLPGMAARIAYAAMCALNAIDPDNDGDIDLSTSSGTDSSSSEAGATNGQPTDNNMESVTCPQCGTAVAQTVTVCSTCGAPIANAEAHAEGTEKTEATVAEETTTQDAPKLSEATLKTLAAMVAEALKPAPPAEGVGTATETAPAEGTGTDEGTATTASEPVEDDKKISRKEAKKLAEKAAEDAAKAATEAAFAAFAEELRKNDVAFRQGTSATPASGTEGTGTDEEIDFRKIAQMSREDFVKWAGPRVMATEAVRRINDMAQARAGGSTIYEA